MDNVCTSEMHVHHETTFLKDQKGLEKCVFPFPILRFFFCVCVVFETVEIWAETWKALLTGTGITLALSPSFWTQVCLKLMKSKLIEWILSDSQVGEFQLPIMGLLKKIHPRVPYSIRQV